MPVLLQILSLDLQDCWSATRRELPQESCMAHDASQPHGGSTDRDIFFSK